jgi:guanosine-3',5'-bis(diphosphate) 3'-pyrophosphohydrolase
MTDEIPLHRPLYFAAAALAAREHRNDLRKDGRTPYFAHPVRVSMVILREFGFDDDAILAAALLHDVIEDCDTDYEDIAEACDDEVARYVVAMSKDPRLPEAEREPAYDKQLAEGPWQARLIKLADVYDNLMDARTNDGRRKIIGRAERALNLAKNDPQLAGASAKVRGLIETVSDLLERSAS